MRNALAEVSNRIPAPAPAAADSARDVGQEATADAGSARRFLEAGLARLAARAADGAPEARAAQAMVDAVPSADDRAAAAVRLAHLSASRPGGQYVGAPGTEAEAEALYALAFEADAAGATGEAVLILAHLAGSDQGRVSGWLGLSVIACRLRRFEAAEVLSSRCLEDAARHPRALSVAGICALERGDAAGAQSYLAAAARLARASPDLRQDLQAAQRALLLMHLSS